MNIKPVEDYIVVTKNEVTDKVGGLYIPATAGGGEKVPLYCTVVKTGPGKGFMNAQGTWCREPMPFAPGDTVIVAPYNSSMEVREDGKLYLLLRANDIVATVLKRDGDLDR